MFWSHHAWSHHAWSHPAWSHPATAAGGLWNSGLVGAGESFVYVFVTPGIFGFGSTQPGDGALSGVVTVLPAGAAMMNPN